MQRRTEDKHRIVIHTVPPTLREILLGGKPWPPILLDESGHIHAGAAVIDANAENRLKETTQPGDALVRRQDMGSSD